MSNQPLSKDILGLDEADYTPKSKPEKSWPTKAKEAYASGAFDDEVCAIIGVTKAQFNKMYQDIDKFKDLVDYGRVACRAHWYGLARQYVIEEKDKPKLNAATWQFVMKNMYGWGDKNAESNLSADAQSMEELESKLRVLLPKMYKKLNLAMLSEMVINGPPN